jgi:DNA-binding GntR family transcriptional regulator
MSPKRPLRDEVKHQVLERVVRGRLPFGHRINETALAEELGVSRTPLREALLELQREGFLHSATARGFTVRPLTTHEIQEI